MTVSDTASCLKAEAVCAAYGSVEILHTISVSLEPGKITCLLGANGSGKSTLLHVLCGLEATGLQLTAGTVTLQNRNISKLGSREKAKMISFLPQNEHYTWNYTVEEVVLMGRYAYSSTTPGYSTADYHAVSQALDITGCSHLRDRTVFELSGGELQSVLIARSLAQKTQFVLLDEPFSHLDAEKADLCMKSLQKLTRERKIGVVISIHDINLAPLYADQLILLRKGTVMAQGPVSQVFSADLLSRTYGASYGIFDHPYYHKPQAYLL